MRIRGNIDDAIMYGLESFIEFNLNKYINKIF